MIELPMRTSIFFSVVLTLLVLSLTCSKSNAQNLVPNPSFEEYIGCPSLYAQIDSVANWFNPSVYPGFQTGSPDYFNSCASSWVGVPNNFAGYQMAHSGEAYGGIVIWGDTSFYDNSREYLEVELTSPLVKDSCYSFSSYLNIANYSRFAIDSLSVHFSDTVIQGVNNWYPIDVAPHISYQNGFLADTVNWMEFNGIYQASGGEQYMLIGNFNDDLNTNSSLINNCCEPTAYILIDDVSLVKTTCPFQVGIDEIQTDQKKLIRRINLAGEEIEEQSNTFIIYIYSDGTTEKRFKIE